MISISLKFSDKSILIGFKRNSPSATAPPRDNVAVSIPWTLCPTLWQTMMVTIHRPKVQSLVCFHYTNRLYSPEFYYPHGRARGESRLGCHSMRVSRRYQPHPTFRHSRVKGRKTRGSFFRRDPGGVIALAAPSPRSVSGFPGKIPRQAKSTIYFRY